MSNEDASIEALRAVRAVWASRSTPADVSITVEMRRIHEIAAVQLACERATLKNFEALRSILKRTEAKIAESRTH